MTDGPFKNLKLGSCWKRLADALPNDAASPAECGSLALDALTRDFVTKEHVKALQKLDEHLGRGQLELDPLGSIEAILDSCEKTPSLDALQKELLFRVANNMSLGNAIAPALDAVINNQIDRTRNRFHEECIRAYEAGEMSRGAAARTHEKIDSAFNAVECAKIREALLGGKKDAFKADFGRIDGVDEGMVRL